MAKKKIAKASAIAAPSDGIEAELRLIRSRLDVLSIHQQLMLREIELLTGRQVPKKLTYTIPRRQGVRKK